MNMLKSKLKITLEELTTPAKRLEALELCLGLTVEAQLMAARIFAKMEDAGDDVSAVRPSTRKKLRAIYRGVVLPEVFVALHGPLCTAACRVPVALQKAILADEPQRLVTDKGDVLLTAPSKMSNRQLRQVFARGYVRDDAEQRAWMEDERFKAAKADAGEPSGPTVDKKNGVVHANGKEIWTREELLRCALMLE